MQCKYVLHRIGPVLQATSVRTLSLSAAALDVDESNKMKKLQKFTEFNAYEFRGSKRFQEEIKAGVHPEFEHRFSRGVREPYLPKGMQEVPFKLGKSKKHVRYRDNFNDWKVKPNLRGRQTKIIDAAIYEDATMFNEPVEKEFIPEMVPDIIVPDLEGFKLKPYVSYRAPDIENSEFTPQDLFHAVYTDKIVQDFKDAKINEDGSSKEPSEEELLTKEEARLKVAQTGSDYIW